MDNDNKNIVLKDFKFTTTNHIDNKKSSSPLIIIEKEKEESKRETLSPTSRIPMTEKKLFD